jgi:1,2-diacylglycerol 3-beta-galactosyltransferase
MKNITILMSDTGGGHRASAEALKAAFEECYADQVHVDVVDLWIKHTPWPINQLPKTYRFLVDDTPWLWKLLWITGDRLSLVRLALRIFSYWVERPIRQAFEHYRPDLIITVHPLMHEIPLLVLDRMRWRLPFVTVVTDLASINALWFHAGVDLCFVASDEAVRKAEQVGLSPHKVRKLGLPIRPAFARSTRPRTQLRQDLGLDPDLPVALLVGGGEGMGPVAEIARRVARRLAQDSGQTGVPAGQLAVICGRNRKLQHELSRLSWPIPTVVTGFVQNMPEWMSASNCIITKAGPGTIAEALVCGLPILLSGYIAGQEEGNVPFVLENGVGAYSEDPQEIARIVGEWFGPQRSQLDHMAERARSMGRPQATYQIVQEIVKLLGDSPS